MKVALCLRGQPRVFRSGYSHLYEFLQRYQPDVFGHCWWDPAIVGQNYSTAPHAPKHYIAEEDTDKKLNLLYNFKVLQCEAPKFFKPKRQYNISENHDNVYNSLKSSYYSQGQVLRILEQYEKENNIDYDWTIITRYDIGLFKPFPDLSQFDRDHIYVSNYHPGRPLIWNDNMWVFGKYKYVFKTLYEDFDAVYDMMFNFTPEQINLIQHSEIYANKNISGEQHIALHLLYHGLLPNVISTDLLNYNLIRN